jgi:uncharacterized lipoprotein
MNLPRLALILATVLVAAGCAETNCLEPQAYHQARLHPPVTAPSDLAPVVHSDAYAVPGTPPGEGYSVGACLVRPPRLVEVPAEEG